MYGFPANAPLILAVVGDYLFALPLGEANTNPKPVLALVLLPVPVNLLSVDGERIELGLRT